MEKRILFNLSTLMLLCFFFNTGMAAHFNRGPVNHADSNTKEAFVGTMTVDNLVNESCAGNNDGSVDLTLGNLGNATSVIVFIQGNSTGSSQTATWTVASGSATGSFSNLEPDTYALQLLANNSTTGASPPPTFTIAPGGALIALVESLPTCNGNSDGSLMVNATGGVAPYEYSINAGRYQSGSLFGGLSAGSHVINVRDASGCITSETYQLTEPDVVAATLTLTPPTCNGGSNGWIGIQATGGDGNYEYSFDGGTTFSTTASLTGLSAGNYSIVVRDGNSCSIAQTPTLTEPTAVTSSLVGSTDALCFNQSNGTVTLDASGGTGTYSVWFQNSLGGGFLRSFTVNSPITGIEPGTYTLQVNDDNGCQDPNTISVTITEPTQLEASSSISAAGVTANSGSTLQTIICSGSTADITVSATGGTAPYEYSIDGTNYVSTATFSNLGPGVYEAHVRDANGCTDQVASTRTIAENDPISFNVTTQDATCFGVSDGRILTSNVQGGSGTGYTYSIDGVNFQSSMDFIDLAPGSYTVTIKDFHGCIGTASATISEPVESVLSVNVLNQVSCLGGNDGSIEASITNTTGTVSYVLDGGTPQTSTTFTGLAAGSYTLEATHGQNNCISSATFTITEPATALSATVNVTDISCNGAADGAFEMVITGGTAPYEAGEGGTNFIPVTAIQSFTVGTENTFSPVIRDANGCTFTIPTFTVNEPAAITATFTELAPCPEDSNGQIIVAAMGGTAPYMYKLGTGNLQSSDTFTGLSSGAQTIEIEDANGCTATFTATVPDATPITATLVTTDVQCFGDSNGTIMVTNIMGGTAPYEYSIDGGMNFQTSDTFTNLTPGSYDITVRDAAQCSSASLSGVVGEPATALSFTVDASTDALCNGASDGSVTISVTGGVAPYTYNDALLGSTVAITGTTATISGLPAGVRDMQNFSISDANGCEVTGNFTINEPSPLTIVVDSRTNITCNGANDGTVTFLAAGGTGAYEYSLDGVNFQASGFFENLTTGSRQGFVRDANGCTTNSASFPVFEPNPVITSVTVDADVTNCGNPDGALTVTASGHFVATNYEFSIDGGGTYQSSGNFTGLAAGTYNIAVRTEFGTCEQTLTATIADAPEITADVTTTNTTSCGVSDGTITVSNVMNGTGPYMYNLGGGTPQSSPVFTGLAPGVYNVFIEGANLCDGPYIVATISEPTGVTADFTGSSVSCSGDATGTVTVSNVSGGTAPYEYSFDGGNTFGSALSLTGLDADVYEVIIKDATNCRLFLTAEVTEPDNINTVITVTDITCNGDASGEISINGSGGTGTLQYSIDGTNFQTSGTFTGLAAGVYSITVKDDNDCSLNYTRIISESAAITASITGTTNVTCNGGDDGTATIAVSGGTAPYEVSIDGTQFFPVPPGGVFTNVGAIDIPTIMVRDANGCEININGFTITEPNPIELEALPEAVSCNGDTDGAINVSASSDSGNPFEYSLDGTNFVSTARFDNLTPGVYTVTALETITMCTTTTQVTVGEPDELVLNATAIDINCNGADDGQIKVESTGGTAPYEYSLDGTNFQTTDFTGLAAGNYTVTVRDAQQCTTNASYIIAEPTALAASFTTTDAVCNGEANGSITVDISGGTAPYSWSDPLTFTDGAQAITGTTATFDAIGGTRMNQAAVVDANGCEFTIDFTISEPDAIVGTASAVTNVTCNGASDGSFTVTAMGGTGLYTYSIDGTNFSATNTFTGLAAGTYIVSIQDESNCIATITQAITEPMVLALQFESVDITCNGAGDGQIAGIATGGTSPYTYSIDGTTFQSTAFSGLAAGSYTLIVKDANDCEATTTVDISEPAVLATSITSTSDVDCNGNSTGSAVLAVTGGSTPYSYSLDGSTFDTSIDLTSLSAGAYTVTIRDANSCEATTSFTITEPDVLGVSLGMVNDVSCNSGTDGSISITGAGGTAPYEYAIDGTTFGSADTFSNLAAGSYTVTLQDANGCTATVAATVTEPAAITLSFTTVDLSCNGDSSGEIVPGATGGTGSYEYSLDGTNFQSAAFSGQAAGTYTLTVRDGNSCTATASVTLTEPVVLSGTAAVTDILCFGDSNGSITVTAAGGTAPYEYSTDGSTFQPGDSFSALAAGSYTVTVRDANSCTVTVAATIAEPTELTVSANVINDNTISVTATGGTAPYEYALDNGTFQAASTFSGLANGDYSITVRDTNGCTVSTTSSLVITGEDDPFTPVSISAYPNPVSDYLTFSRLSTGDQIRLVSLNGNSLDLTLITEEKVEYRKDISGIRQKVFLAIVISKDGKIKLNQKVMKRE